MEGTDTKRRPKKAVGSRLADRDENARWHAACKKEGRSGRDASRTGGHPKTKSKETNHEQEKQTGKGTGSGEGTD